MTVSLKRWLGIGGLAFVVLVVVATALTPNTPSTNATLSTILSYYHDHKSVEYASAYLIALAVFVGLFFFWYLRDLLSTVESNRRLATVGFAGAVVFAVSGGLTAGINWTLASSVGNVGPGTLQTLNALQNGAAIFLASAGSAVFLVATGSCVIRSGVLPRWLGWVAVVLGVIALVVPFGPVEAGLWVLITCIVILVRARRGDTDAVAPAPHPEGLEVG